ncbi:hypothetical protein [Amycolatopsis sp. Poz14]|uniref:hypothetical protein n=1 Tax=Amycolatopsis sp. Poz14 TaxID=1447705 RepID=UPI001EE7F387|nr:hypothetical protein [Amycolatopsis sp. Poz14]
MTGNTMGGRRHADRPGAVSDAEVTVPGRHRVRADGTWTPVVPPRTAGHHRHRTGAVPAVDGAPVQRGSENPRLRGAPAPRANRVPDDGNRPAPNQPVFPTASGTLPIGEPPLPQPQRRRATSDRRAPVEPPRRQASAPDRLAEPRQTAAFPGQPSEPRGHQTAAPAQPGTPQDQQVAAPLARQPESRAAFAPPQDRIPEEHRAFAPPESALPQPTRRTRQERVATTSAALANRPESPRERVELNPVAEEPPRRQRVTLGEPAVSARESQEQQDDEVRVYAAPLLDGLGTFDLGSVPASVTPPKTWRKAAWFATGASGAVVVGLLFAGTFLVGGPTTTTTDAVGGGGWPGRQNGGNPNLSALIPNGQHGGVGGSVPRSDSSTSPDGVTSDNGTHPQQGSGPNSSASSSSAGVTTSAGPGTGTGSSTSAPTTTDSPSSSEPPQKPPVTPAERETKGPPVFTAGDADTMGNNSEKFFNNVTTDPSEASSVTSGDLKQQGPQGLRKRYADVAYFEVKKVTIDPQHGTTVNTVEVTHQDGSKSTEQQTLTFDDNGKITDDGR